jgi:serine/threonine protein phosphatase PrpC
VGPYRVWRGSEHYPGLAIAMSLGDTIAANLGVISTPEITVHKLDFTRDMFLVAGSDGLW